MIAQIIDTNIVVDLMLTLTELENEVKAALELDAFAIHIMQTLRTKGLQPDYDIMPSESEVHEMLQAGQAMVSPEVKTILGRACVSNIGFDEYLICPTGKRQSNPVPMQTGPEKSLVNNNYFLYVGRGFNSKPTDPIVVWMYADGQYMELKASQRNNSDGTPKQTSVAEAVDEYVRL